MATKSKSKKSKVKDPAMKGYRKKILKSESGKIDTNDLKTEVLRLSFTHGYSVKSISKRMNLSQSDVKQVVREYQEKSLKEESKIINIKKVEIPKMPQGFSPWVNKIVFDNYKKICC